MVDQLEHRHGNEEDQSVQQGHQQPLRLEAFSGAFLIGGGVGKEARHTLAIGVIRFAERGREELFLAQDDEMKAMAQSAKNATIVVTLPTCAPTPRCGDGRKKIERVAGDRRDLAVTTIADFLPPM